MNEKIQFFVEELKKRLDGLEEEDKLDAVSYYEEYLYDAVDSGKSPGDAVRQLGDLDVIAAKIKAEASIIKAQQKPGLKNYGHVMGNIFHVVKAPFSVILLSVFVSVSWSVVALLYSGAFITITAAAAVLAGLIYEAFSIPAGFTAEIAGTSGIAFFAASVLLIAALGQYKLGKLFVKISSRLIGRMLKKPGKLQLKDRRPHTRKKILSKKIIYFFTALSLAGLVLFMVSGIPARYFTIFNSMKAEKISIKTWEYKPEEVSNISIVTAHSHIVVESNTAGRIILKYEQPDWLEYEIGKSGSMLSFYEKSNGRLPLFDLVKIHESITELTVSLPEKFDPEIFTIESSGGQINIKSTGRSVEVKTYTGKILFNRDSINNLKATAKNGSIEVAGSPAGQKTNKGIEYYNKIGAGKTAVLESARGDIVIY